MNRSNRGFGLIELLIALALSLVVVLGVVQIFIAAKDTYVSQNTAAGMQEDARFVLSKLIQEIRMVGMFGCLEAITDSSLVGDFAAAWATPISWDNANGKLTLVTADVGSSSVPTWTVVSECRASLPASPTPSPSSTAYTGARPLTQEQVASGQLAFPIRRLIYSFSNNQLLMGTGAGTPAQAVLVDNVSAFDVSFGLATADEFAASSYSSNPTPSDLKLIRSVRLTLTLTDPKKRVRDQTFNVVAALRNRLR
ncbi:prepilin-type N-terminal cleavage/methylation domain-containing protein [Pseudomonas sp. TH39(2020)]|uniref:prepilin-type N-terminal cleavage/methylation domain-containing protein n=1 Tax=Pseudomonas sp. TH39(2020) TaxID=2796349 RepID=UPI001912A108|nr:prepilin-type N-terminal cleavage/methylation domain-containing protein [Pseudomonas sp. TH39(2020)]MBK5399288.1 prepilin-type N-terminal cleavage/methylation domain-containing protein [Pseudomonas sp. TH39(2020)]